MSMNELVKQSMHEAQKITGTDGSDEHTQEIAFKLACAAMAQEIAAR